MLLKHWLDDAELSVAEFARLSEQGYIDVLNENGSAKVVPHCVILENEEIKAALLTVGSQIKERHWDAFCRPLGHIHRRAPFQNTAAFA